VLVLHIPHASAEIPDALRGSIELSDDELAVELLRMTDAHTDKLFGRGDLPSVRFPVSRLVVDPERFPEDADEPMAERGMGVLYTHTSTGGVLRTMPDRAERERLIERYYAPHHAALEAAVAQTLASEAECIVVDCHSFPSAPLPYEINQDVERPDLCLGSDEFHSPQELVEVLADEAESLGWSVAINSPFAGALVPLEFYRKKPSVLAVMLEVNRSLYMDETTGKSSSQFDETQEKLAHLLSVIEDWQHETFPDRLQAQAEMMAQQYWDSGGPGAGAGWVTAYDYFGVFVVVDDAGWRVVDSAAEALRDVTAETDATVSVEVFSTGESSSSGEG